MDRNKPSESYLYRSLLDESDSSVRELVGYLRSNEIGELGQLYRTAEAIHRYLKSEVIDYLATKKKASPDVIVAAMKHMTNNDPSFPGHELLSELAVTGLSTFIRLKREYTIHAAHDFFVNSVGRPSNSKVSPSDIDLSEFGIGVLPQMSITGIRAKRPYALKLTWYMSKQVERKMIVLSGYNSRQLDVMYLTKFKSKPKKISPDCVIVPFEVWDSNRNKLNKYLDILPEEARINPELIVMTNPDGLGNAELEVRDKAAAVAVGFLKEFCCVRKIPGVAVVCCPMIKHQDNMPPVSWYSMYVNENTGVARMVGPNKSESRLEFWRHA